MVILLFFVNWKSNFDTELKEHMRDAPENAKYTSPSIQNEIISLCEKHIREKVLASIPKYWSILADVIFRPLNKSASV